MIQDQIEFTKMSGAGNDFIIIDNRQSIIAEADLPAFAAAICRRKLSIGADGLMLFESSAGADFGCRIFNADGSAADMCGNGARCIARYAHLRGLTGPQMAFETGAGVIRAQVGDTQVRIQMTDPYDLIMDRLVAVNGYKVQVSSINTGVPHAVVRVDNVAAAPVVSLGRALRMHAEFGPDGTNVNFVAPAADGLLQVRTYERGVEDETLACGTGSVAAAIVVALQDNLTSPVRMQTRSGSCLDVHFDRSDTGVGNVYLSGDARLVYSGRLTREALDQIQC